jgi:hypothetical protein
LALLGGQLAGGGHLGVRVRSAAGDCTRRLHQRRREQHSQLRIRLLLRTAERFRQGRLAAASPGEAEEVVCGLHATRTDVGGLGDGHAQVGAPVAGGHSPCFTFQQGDRPGRRQRSPFPGPQETRQPRISSNLEFSLSKGKNVSKTIHRGQKAPEVSCVSLLRVSLWGPGDELQS